MRRRGISDDRPGGAGRCGIRLWRFMLWGLLACPGWFSAACRAAVPGWPPAVLPDVSGAVSAADDSLRLRPDRVAQRVRISGVAPGAAGRTIRWRVAADPLSGLSWEVDACRIADDGAFSLQGMFRETMPTVLEIDYYSGTLFVTPGADYRLRFHPYDYTLDRRLNVFFPGTPVPPLTFDIEAPADERLNHALWAFLTLYGQEIDAAAYEDIVVYGRPEAVLRLRTRVDSLEAALWPQATAGGLSGEAPGVRPARRDTPVYDFVSAYIRYQMAALEEFAGLKSGKVLFRQYLRQQPLLYRNPAQMQFVRAYFEAYFEARCPIPEKRLKRLLAGADVQPVLDTLGVDSLLVNRVLREWVYMLAVAEVLEKPDYPAEALRGQLAQLAERTSVPMHRQTIAGLLERARRRREGIGLKPYVWTDGMGRAVAADTLLAGRGWHYICLVKSDPTLSPEGSAQVYALWQALRQDRSGAGRGLVLVCDDDTAAARTYVRALQAALQPPASDAPAADAVAAEADGVLSFYHFNREIENLRDWEVYTFPAFVVVSPEGRIYTRFAPPVPDGVSRWQTLMNPEKAAAGNRKSRHGGR